MAETLFYEDLYDIDGENVALRLIGTYEGGAGTLPFYWWEILSKQGGIPVGKISFRIGHNDHSYYNGNVGYEVDAEHRGHHYSLQACRLALRAARYHGMDKVYLTCEHDNAASFKTIERLGARLIEEVLPPRDYIYYREDMKIHRIYELKIN